MKEKEKKIKEIKKHRGSASYSKSVRATWFVVHLSFVQLICKASLILESNLELALSIILKESFESKHVVVECRCLKIWDLLSFLICSSILVLKWRQVSPL